MTEPVKSIEDWENPVLALMTSLATMQKTGFAPMVWLAPQMLEKCGEMNAALSQFIAARIKEDVNLQHKILHCRDLAKLHRIQAEFFQKAIDQYTAETGKLTQLGQEMLQGATHPKAG